jgi:hypothetical protein
MEVDYLKGGEYDVLALFELQGGWIMRMFTAKHQ